MKPSPWTIPLRTLWVANLVAATGMFALVPFLTCFVQELGVTDAAARHRWAGWLVGSAPIMAALVGPLWGGIGDRFGRRAMVARALFGGAIFVGLMWWAESLWSMLGLRALQGCVAGFVPPALALASLLAPEERRAYLTGSIQSAVSAGAVLGYLLGGYVTEHGSLRIIFPICAGLLGLAGILVVALVPEVRTAPRPDARSSLAARIVDDYRYTLGIPALARFLAILVAVRLVGSMIDPHFVAFVEGLGGSRDLAGAILALEQGAILIAMPRFARASERFGYRRTFAAAALGLCALWFVQSRVQSAGALIAVRIASGLCLGGIAPVGYGLAARETSPERRGSAMGTVFQALAFAHAAGTLIGGAVVGAIGFRPVMLGVGASFGCLAALALRESRKDRAFRSLPPPKEAPSWTAEGEDV